MSNKKIKVSLVMITFFAALGLFILLFSTWSETTYNQPLTEYLDNHDDISKFEVKDVNNDDFKIMIEFEYHHFINETILEIEEEIEAILGNKNWEIKYGYCDDNESFKEAFYNLHFALHEARANGNFNEMQDQIDRIMENHPIEHYQIHIFDDSRILVQMQDNDGFYLHILKQDLQKSDQGRT